MFVSNRAKLGYGLLSGEYSKPAPDPGEENAASEPRVRRNAFANAGRGRPSVRPLTGSVSLHARSAGRPNRHRAADVQSPRRAGPPRVLHQSAAGRPGVFIALHKHGRGKFPPCSASPAFAPRSRCDFVYLRRFNFEIYLYSSRREIAALVQTRPRPSGFWWRRRSCVSSPRRPSTPSGWTTSSSCPCPWTRPPTQVAGSASPLQRRLPAVFRSSRLKRFSNRGPCLHLNRRAPGGRAAARGGGLLGPDGAGPDPLRGVHGGPQRAGDPHGLLELGRPDQDHRHQVREGERRGRGTLGTE